MSDQPLCPLEELPISVRGRDLVLLVYPTRVVFPERLDRAPYVPLVVASRAGSYVATCVQTLRTTHVLDGDGTVSWRRALGIVVEAQRERVGRIAWSSL